jgi:hypothetical protein
MNEHGYCPNCNLDLDGSLVWDHFYKQYNDEVVADKYAKLYGATRTTGRWSRAIGYSSMELDRTTGWSCPDCDHFWGHK